MHLRRRTFRSMLVATTLSSALVAGVGAGVGPAAAATPERTGRAPTAADTPTRNVTKDKRTTAPKARTQRKLRKATALDTYRYQLRVSGGRQGGYASASGRVEMTDTGASNRGMVIDGGNGTATLEFGLVRAEGPSAIKTIKADNERTPSDWNDDAKLTQVRIRLCKVVDPADPSKSICKQVNHPEQPEQ